VVALQPRSIVEIGVGSATRSLRMFEAVGRYGSPAEVRYTGIDPFEGTRVQARIPQKGEPEVSASAHPSPPSQQLGTLPLKEAYKLLRAAGPAVRLVPGEPGMALRMAAHPLASIDLVVIDGAYSDSDLATAWRPIRTIMGDASRVIRFAADGSGFIELGADDVERLATGPTSRAA
jgi:hypothetical protein